MSILVSTCISYHLTVGIVLASNSTSSDENDATMKALLTVGILVGCVVIALVVAKIVDSCYDHHLAVDDNASDISEDTRKLVRMRLAVNAFSRLRKYTNDSSVMSTREKQKKIIRMWSARAKESRRIAEQRRAMAAAERQSNNKAIIKVEEATGDAKITAANVATTFMTMTETSSKRKSMLTPKPERGGKLSPNHTPSRANSLTPNKLSPRLTTRTTPITPRSTQKSESSSSHTPEVKKVVTGLDTNKDKALAASPTHVVRSGKVSVEAFSEGLLESCGDVLTVDLDGEGQGTYRSAVDFGLDSVHSETNVDLVALSCRSDIREFTGSLLQGIDTKNTMVEDQDPVSSESHKTVSVKSDPPQAVGSQSHTVPDALSISQNCEVLNINDSERNLKETEEEERPEPSKTSLTTSTPGIMDSVGMDVGSTDNGPFTKDSHNGPENNPEGFSIEKRISPRSREIFTITLPSEQPNPGTYKLSQQASNSENELPSLERAFLHSNRQQRGKSRPQSFSVRDMSKLKQMPPRMAQTVRLYSNIRSVFNIRKDIRGSEKILKSKTGRGSNSHSCSVAPDQYDRGQALQVTDIAEEIQTHSEKF